MYVRRKIKAEETFGYGGYTYLGNGNFVGNGPAMGSGPHRELHLSYRGITADEHGSRSTILRLNIS
jgi:hypothetical protein